MRRRASATSPFSKDKIIGWIKNFTNRVDQEFYLAVSYSALLFQMIDPRYDFIRTRTAFLLHFSIFFHFSLLVVFFLIFFSRFHLSTNSANGKKRLNLKCATYAWR